MTTELAIYVGGPAHGLIQPVGEQQSRQPVVQGALVGFPLGHPDRGTVCQSMVVYELHRLGYVGPKRYPVYLSPAHPVDPKNLAHCVRILADFSKNMAQVELAAQDENQT